VEGRLHEAECLCRPCDLGPFRRSMVELMIRNGLTWKSI
jgi:hypothetical protein